MLKNQETCLMLPAVFNGHIGFLQQPGGATALFKPDPIESKRATDKQARFKALYVLIRQNVYRFGRLSTFSLYLIRPQLLSI
uniref:Uncharacterized protein n=1 Tax=Psychrobacter sp. (strain PRwf-1) TaxID=349106 RepID=A5WE55_PSYWF